MREDRGNRRVSPAYYTIWPIAVLGSRNEPGRRPNDASRKLPYAVGWPSARRAWKHSRQ